MKKRLLCVLLCIVLVVPAAVACSGQKGNNEPGQTNGDEKSEKQVTILVAAAASLRYCMEDELKGMFEGLHPNIRVTFTLDSSKLQKQIEEGRMWMFCLGGKEANGRIERKGADTG